MKNYKTMRLRLMPLHKFYFGGERTLGADNADYFVTSNKFPQQTTLLGALRYKILVWKDALTDSSGHCQKPASEREKWIGPRSFSGGFKNTLADYGIIGSISPCLLYDGKGYWVTTPKASDRKGNSFPFKPVPGKASLINGTSDSVPFLHGYDHKGWYPPSAVNLKNGHTKPFVKSDKDAGIFYPVTRIGITKPTKKYPDQKKNFYKQTSWRFTSPGWSFVCWVRMEESLVKDFQQHLKDYPILPMGGERSLFRMELEEAALPDFSKMAGLTDSGYQVVLLSDAWVPNRIYDEAAFSVSEAVGFRHIGSSVGKTKHFADLAEDTETKLSKSNRFAILERGSVLFSKDIPDELELPQHFRQIGFNAYVQYEQGKLTKTEFLFEKQ